GNLEEAIAVRKAIALLRQEIGSSPRENTRTTKPESIRGASVIGCVETRVDLDCVHAEDGLHLHGVRIVQDIHEAGQNVHIINQLSESQVILVKCFSLYLRLTILEVTDTFCVSNKVDLVNPEGHWLVPDVSKPLPLGRPPGQIESECEYDISVAYGISYWWFKHKEIYITRQIAPSDRSIVMSHMWILSVVSLKTYKRYGYTFLKEIVLCRADYNEYKISKADFKNLHPNDFEDLYLLHLQGQLNHLSGDDKVHLFNAVNLWIRNIVIRKRVEDLQLGIEKIIRETEVHKFNDGTLKRILDKLDHMVKDFKLFEYNPGMEIRIWSENDRRRSKEFMEVIERRLKIRRIFRSLESFVGGRLRDVDYRLI
ncbi:hypothetical protein Tco_0919195, partial [Tanacetum coccineum]